jgi:hypothetical protein
VESSSSNFHDSNNINQNFSSETTQPYFDFSVTRNVTTRVGQTAFLHCRVEALGDKLVRKSSYAFVLLGAGVVVRYQYVLCGCRQSHTQYEMYADENFLYWIRKIALNLILTFMSLAHI